MKTIAVILFFVAAGLMMTISTHAGAEHEMQHGFIIADDDSNFSHLVAPGHHSHQLSFSGTLFIQSSSEIKYYLERKKLNAREKKSYFLFQAQKLNLPRTHSGQTLVGHIVESPIGDYTPQNIIIRDAKILVEDVHVNVINPFFLE